jgi:hypothetical protein
MKMTKDYSFTDDTLDVRDLIERYEDLEAERDSFFDDRDFPDSERGNKENPIWEEWEKSDEAAELNRLQDILEELKGNGGDEQWGGDWYPITLINSDYFTDYTKELVEDCGYINRPKGKSRDEDALPWWIEIDWEKTADNCKVDYTSIDIEEETFYYR